MNENAIHFSTRNFRKFNQMQSDQGLKLPCGHVFYSVCCVLSCRLRRKNVNVFGIFGLFCLQIVTAKEKIRFFYIPVELSICSGRKNVIDTIVADLRVGRRGRQSPLILGKKRQELQREEKPVG